jgi:perosamine synthetase
MLPIVADTITSAIQRALLPATGPFALHEPMFRGQEWEYVKECLDTGWVSSVGPHVDEFESQLATLTQVESAVATVNGTAALHLALLLAGVQHGDEVIVPTLTFIATVNSIAYCGATPHFADSSQETLGLDPIKLREHLRRIAVQRGGVTVNSKTARPIRAIIAMHTFGHPVDMDPLNELASEFGVIIVEDAAEALGSYYKGRPCGSLATIGTLSFNGNKIVTTGGGGALLLSDPELGRRAKHLSTTAKTPHPWLFLHDEIGYNYRLPNINAALGIAQLKQLPDFLAAKRTLSRRYREAFADVESIFVFDEPPFAKSNFWLNTIMVPDDTTSRDAILRATNDAGLQTRPVWTLIHRLPMYRDCPQMNLSVAESLERRIVNLPSSPSLGGSR